MIDQQGEFNAPDHVLGEFKEYQQGDAPRQWRSASFSGKKTRRLKSAGAERSFDYTAMSASQAWENLDKDLIGALRKGVRFVELIHGEGVHKSNIRNWLIECKWVLAFHEPKSDPGSVVAELKRAKPKRAILVKVHYLEFLKLELGRGVEVVRDRRGLDAS